jgi:tyrosyl-tRNA synthetase
VGRDFQRDAGQEPQICLTLPILVGTDGVKKMSKSLGNTIGISEPPEEIFGKTMSIPDDLILSYFELGTDRPMDEARRVLDDEGPMAAKMRLGRALVTVYYDEAVAQAAEEHFNRTVREKEAPEDIPEVKLGADALKDGKVWIVRLVTEVGFANSNREARQLISQGGVSLNDETVDDPGLDVAISDGDVLQVGKRRYATIRL